MQLDDDAHPLAIRLVVQRRDPGDALFLVRVRDRLEDAVHRDLKRHFADDDAMTPALFDDLGPAAQRHRTAAGLVRLADRFAAEQHPAGREVRPVDALEEAVVELVVGAVRTDLVDEVRDGIADLTDVVGRDVRRHADRDPRAAVDEQLRQAGGEHDRLFGLIVEVGDEVDGLFVDVREHLERDTRETRFGVAIGGRRVGIDRAEVAVSVDERIAQREVLRHADERVVDRRVAVRVKALQHLADDAGAFAVLLRGIESHLAHRVEDAPLHRLEAVAHVGERA